MDKYFKELLQEIFLLLSVLVLIILVGTFGIRLIEGWPLLDCLWHVIITISTVGYTEIHPLSRAGKIFTMLLILTALGTYAYAATKIAYLLLEGEFRKLISRKRMDMAISKLKDHVIICGLGRTGFAAAKELYREKIPFVAVEKDESSIKRAVDVFKELRYIAGDATEDQNLQRAGISRARTIIITTPSDADTLFITVSAKNLNPKIRVVARVSDERNVQKLKAAGADEVISPNIIGGIRMASVAVRPDVVSFLDIITKQGDVSLRLEELKIPQHSPFCGRLLGNLKLPERTGVLVVAIKRRDGSFIFNPSSKTMILPQDTLIAIGNAEQFQKLRDLIAGRA